MCVPYQVIHDRRAREMDGRRETMRINEARVTFVSRESLSRAPGAKK